MRIKLVVELATDMTIGDLEEMTADIKKRYKENVKDWDLDVEL